MVNYMLCSPAGSPSTPPRGANDGAPDGPARLALPPPPTLGSSLPNHIADDGAPEGPALLALPPPLPLLALPPPPPQGSSCRELAVRDGDGARPADVGPRPPPTLGSSCRELALRDGGDARPTEAGAGAGAGGCRRLRRSPPPRSPPKRPRRGSSWSVCRSRTSEGESSRTYSRSRSPDYWPHSGYGATADDLDNTERLGLMTYKQFTLDLEDDVSPAQTGDRYQQYRTEYIATQKRAYFDLNKNEDWLKDMYHPTKLLPVIERRKHFCKTIANNLILDLLNGTLDLGPGVTADAQTKTGDGNKRSSGDGAEYGEMKRKHGRGPRKEIEALSAAPKAHPVSSQYRRIQADIDRTLALVKKLDSEKDIVGNILLTGNHDKSNVDKSCIGPLRPIVIVRGSNTVKGLEGVELLDTLLTYLWRVHGVDYYGMSEMKYAKGFRHVRAQNKSGSMADNINAADWEKKLDSFWEERLMNGQDPLVVLTAKDKIDAAIVEVLEPYVMKMWDEKFGWKYGCGVKGCEKLFHAPEYVHRHLRLKHPDFVSILASRVENDIYFQNYMNDPEAPGGKPVMQQKKHGRIRRRPDEHRYGASGGHSSDSSLLPTTSLVPRPVPGAGPYGPFVLAPPEMDMQMMPNGLPGPDAARHMKPSVLGPMLPMYPSFPLDRRIYRSYEDLDASRYGCRYENLDAPEEEIDS